MPSSPTPRSPVRYCSAADGTRIAFEQIGRGPPILKSSNWMSHLDEDRGSPLWRHWLQLLADGRQLTRFDGRGFGLSERQPPALDFDAMLADIDAVADAAKLDHFPILGFCHGGPLAIAYAARHPERVSCLVLCGTYAEGRAVRDRSAADAAEREMLLKLIELGWGQDNPAYRQVFATKAMPQAGIEALSSYCAIQRASATPEQALKLTQVFWHIDVAALLPQITCPVLVLHARGDALVPFTQGQLLAQQIAGAQFVPLDSANHDLQEDEAAWAVLSREVGAFLARHAAPALAPDGRDLAALTERERGVLEHLARGLDNHEIAAALFLSEKTVRNHVTAIFAKLDFASRGRAIVWAREAGLGRG